MFRGLMPIFMHNPVCFPSIRGTSLVEDQGLPHPYDSIFGHHSLVPSSGFPESSSSGPIGSCSSRILLIFMAEKVPFILLLIS